MTDTCVTAFPFIPLSDILVENSPLPPLCLTIIPSQHFNEGVTNGLQLMQNKLPIAPGALRVLHEVAGSHFWGSLVTDPGFPETHWSSQS